MIGVMTGPWVIVKWVGITVAALYLVLLVAVIWRVRGEFSRLRFVIFVPLIVGGFIGISLPGIFEKAVVARVCFLVGHTIYLYGVVVLVKAIARDGRTGLLRDN